MFKVINKNTLVSENADREMIRRDEYGDNNVTRDKRQSLPRRLAKAFINPFTSLFFALAALLAFTGKVDSMVVMFISAIVLVYGLLRFE